MRAILKQHLYYKRTLKFLDRSISPRYYSIYTLRTPRLGINRLRAINTRKFCIINN